MINEFWKTLISTKLKRLIQPKTLFLCRWAIRCKSYIPWTSKETLSMDLDQKKIYFKHLFLNKNGLKMLRLHKDRLTMLRIALKIWILMIFKRKKLNNKDVSFLKWLISKKLAANIAKSSFWRQGNWGDTWAGSILECLKITIGLSPNDKSE